MSGRPARHTRATVALARVLIVEVPGWALTRFAVERAVVARGWRVASTPAEADVLILCGRPGADWNPMIARLWAQLPGARARVDAATPDDAVRVLERAASILLDDAATSATSVVRVRNSGRTNGAREGKPDSSNDPDDADDAADHDMDEMDMPMPGGIPLAAGDQDRDGLEMDVLSVRIGPVLPAWPAGLELRCVLHGDMIAQADVVTLLGQDPPEQGRADDHRTRAALECDGVARLLTLAGSSHAAAGLCGVRNSVLDDVPEANCTAELTRWTDRLRRSRMLRWSLRGIGGLDRSELTHPGLPDWLAGDVHDRLLARLTGIGRILTSAGSANETKERRRAARAAIDVLPTLVAGLEVGAARLVVASVDPDVAALQGGSTRG